MARTQQTMHRWFLRRVQLAALVVALTAGPLLMLAQVRTGRASEVAGPWPAAPQLELPFAAGAPWVVVAPAEGRRPDRATAWAANFRPSGEAEGGADDTVVAPAAGRVRLLHVQPPIAPVWCKYDGAWVGPQQEVALDLDPEWTVVLGALDSVMVEEGQEVVVGQELGRLSRSTCDGHRALELLLWRRGDGGVRSHPFGTLGGLRDDELVPGRTVVRRASTG